MKREVHFEEPEVESDGSDEEEEGLHADEEKGKESVGYGQREAKVMRESRDTPAGRPRGSEGSSTSSWTDLDLSIMLALAAPIGNWLTGTDHLKNLFLICLMIFYLHQIIEVPWQLYQSAVPRKAAPGGKTAPDADDGETHLRELARSELRQHELFYLGISLASPFIGAHLLKHVLSALSSDGEAPALSWFSITLFMFAVGIRPWSHLIKRLRARTHDLHDTVHYHHLSQNLQTGLEAGSKLNELSDQVLKLEAELQKLRAATEDNKVSLEDEHDDLSDNFKDLKTSLRKYERKSDTGRTSHDRRLQALETTIGFVLEHLKRQEQLRSEDPWNSSVANANGLGQNHPFLHYLASTLLYLPSVFLSVFAPGMAPSLRLRTPALSSDGASGFVNGPHSPSSAKSHVSQIPGLETIAEDSDDSTLSPPSGEGESKEKFKRARSRSRDRRRPRPTVNTSNVVQDLALLAVTLPYRAAQRVLVIASSPIQKHIM
ncbi:hypothetical protein OE88DRAFT_1736101 [Heliocybe sulcata]|uniref:Uncharacterized protein n=1 Tax=Heliocybe sulcata TaxID=5364 RepID=A0A5C3MYL8_9AGAM|nr:hypothetical protein OE88DRAFT_1736101 [Heliocybe sulcata]